MKKYLDISSYDYLGVIENSEIESAFKKIDSE